MSFWEWFSTKFHRHEWVVLKEMPLKVYEGNIHNDANMIGQGTRYVLQCKICGEVKHKDIK